MSDADRIISHIDSPYFAASKCPFHFDRSCFLILNNFDKYRFHCLYALESMEWKSYNASPSCDIPEHFYDLLMLNGELGNDYVLPFNRHFRERSGYTVGMFKLVPNTYDAKILKPRHFKETFYTMIVFLSAISRRLGGFVPNLKLCSFLYTEKHPILVSLGSRNVKKRERFGKKEFFNAKKWTRFMRKKTSRDVIRYLKIIHPEFFKKKMKNNCILNEVFDDETHDLICKSGKLSLQDILEKFQHLMPDEKVRKLVIEEWLQKERKNLESENCYWD